MKRRKFLYATSISLMGASLVSLRELASGPKSSERMPVLFVGHGNPMNAIEKNKYSLAWEQMGKNLPKPKAIVCISAHWETKGTKVTANPHPETIHDFGGFPQALFDAQYPAPGDPELALELGRMVHSAGVQQDLQWGLDHGAWSVLKPMFPLADIPVIQLSLDYTKTPQQHFEFAKELAALRDRGVLVMGSGNIVHNLGRIDWQHPNSGYDWAIEFNDQVKKTILDRNFAQLSNYKSLSKSAELAVPSTEHYLPLLYATALATEKDQLEFFNDDPQMGSLTMTSLKIS
ncbi:MAG TPA: 4,5-DOPA dioxygenase extradiol [Flavobacteriales bacterium]|nr:4,5-DOPA dioxygenase extradiol [Flavobacteriales bacterium]